MLLRQPSTDCLGRQLLMVGEPDHLIGQEFEGPAGSSRAAASEQAVATKSASCLLDSLRSTPGRGSSVSAPSRFASTKRRGSDKSSILKPSGCGDHLVAHAVVRGQEDLRALYFARRVASPLNSASS